jgi:hypothetical protein
VRVVQCVNSYSCLYAMIGLSFVLMVGHALERHLDSVPWAAPVCQAASRTRLTREIPLLPSCLRYEPSTPLSHIIHESGSIPDIPVCTPEPRPILSIALILGSCVFPPFGYHFLGYPAVVAIYTSPIISVLALHHHL